MRPPTPPWPSGAVCTAPPWPWRHGLLAAPGADPARRCVVCEPHPCPPVAAPASPLAPGPRPASSPGRLPSSLMTGFGKHPVGWPLRLGVRPEPSLRVKAVLLAKGSPTGPIPGPPGPHPPRVCISPLVPVPLVPQGAAPPSLNKTLLGHSLWFPPVSPKLCKQSLHPLEPAAWLLPPAAKATVTFSHWSGLHVPLLSRCA